MAESRTVKKTQKKSPSKTVASRVIRVEYYEKVFRETRSAIGGRSVEIEFEGHNEMFVCVSLDKANFNVHDCTDEIRSEITRKYDDPSMVEIEIIASALMREVPCVFVG